MNVKFLWLEGPRGVLGQSVSVMTTCHDPTIHRHGTYEGTHGHVVLRESCGAIATHASVASLDTNHEEMNTANFP